LQLPCQTGLRRRRGKDAGRVRHRLRHLRPPGRLIGPPLDGTVPLCESKFRDFGSLYIGKYCTFGCGSLFPGIKLIELYSRKQTSTYKSMTV
jgi:hypothetical protein